MGLKNNMDWGLILLFGGVLSIIPCVGLSVLTNLNFFIYLGGFLGMAGVFGGMIIMAQESEEIEKRTKEEQKKYFDQLYELVGDSEFSSYYKDLLFKHSLSHHEGVQIVDDIKKQIESTSDLTTFNVGNEVMMKVDKIAEYNKQLQEAKRQKLIEIREQEEVERLRKAQKQSNQRTRRVTLSTRTKVLERDNYTCQMCGRNRYDGVKLEVDHILPVAKGGSDNISNLQTLCFDCNRGKSDKILNNQQK